MNESLLLVLRAASFSAEQHCRAIPIKNRFRKGAESDPYINHPLAVARLLIEEGGVDDPVTLAAALLHDTMEDVPTPYSLLLSEFGAEVADIVKELTDDKALPKEERKRMQVVNAPHKSHKAAMIKMADKICNMRDIANSPPADWNLARKQEYYDWGNIVVSALPKCNSKLEAVFEECLNFPLDGGLSSVTN